MKMTGVRVRFVLIFAVACALFFVVEPAWTAEPAVLVPSGAFEGGRAWRSSVGGYYVLYLRVKWNEMGRQDGGLLSRQLE